MLRNSLVGVAFALLLWVPVDDAAAKNPGTDSNAAQNAEVQVAGTGDKNKGGKNEASKIDKGGGKKADQETSGKGKKGDNNKGDKGKTSKSDDSSPDTAEERDGKDKGKDSEKFDKPDVESDDIDKARRYLSDNPDAFRGNPPKSLPPGIAMNLERGKPLPPGIAKTRLPDGFAGQLPTYPGYDWSLVGQDLVLTDQETNVVVEVFRNMFQ